MAEAVRRHRGPVLAFARRLVGDSGRAEEISQEVFLRLWERSSRFDAQRGSLRAFLLAVTHGRALDVMRSDAARQAREKRDAVRTSAPEAGVEAEVVAQTVADAVHHALVAAPGYRATRSRARLFRGPQLPNGRPDAQRARGHRQEPHPQRLGEAPHAARRPRPARSVTRDACQLTRFSSAQHARHSRRAADRRSSRRRAPRARRRCQRRANPCAGPVSRSH